MSKIVLKGNHKTKQKKFLASLFSLGKKKNLGLKCSYITVIFAYVLINRFKTKYSQNVITRKPI